MKSVVALFVLAFVFFSAVSVRAQSTEYCPLCQFTVQYIEGYLQQNYTETQIIKQLEVLCTLTPPSIANLCDTYVEQYVPLVIYSLIKNENPQTVCSQLHFCSNNSMVAKAMNKVEKQINRGEVECQICKFVVDLAASFVEQHQVLNQIQAYLDNICQESPFPAQCAQFVNTYLPVIISYVKQAESPQVVCGQVLAVCPASNLLKIH